MKGSGSAPDLELGKGHGAFKLSRALSHWAIAPFDCLHSATQMGQIEGTIERFESFLAEGCANAFM
jgi:hypothetical protein